MPVPPGHYPQNYDLTGDFLRQNYVPLRASGGPPSTPTGLTVQGGDEQVLLAWDSATGATSYVVKRSTAPGGPYAAVAPRVTSVVYRDASVVNGTTYYYVVAAVNLAGPSADSAEASATPVGGLNVLPAGISTSQAFGAANVSVVGGAINILPTGIATSQVFGAATVLVSGESGTPPLMMPTYEQYLLSNAGGNIQGYWPLAESGSEYIYQRAGTLVGTAPNFGHQGIVNTNMKAAYMNSGGYRMEARPASPVFLGAPNWTLIVWAKRDGLGTVVNSGTGGYTNFEVLMAKGMAEAESPANVNSNWVMGVREISAGDPRVAQDFEEAAGGSGPLGLNHPMTGNQQVPPGWNMIATTYDGTRHALYLNGVAQTADHGVINPAQPAEAGCIAPFCVGGAMRSDQDTWYGRWNGTMQHAAMWNRAMTPNEIAAFFRVGAGLLAPSVKLYSGSGAQPVQSILVQVQPGTQINGNADTVDDSSFSAVNVRVTRNSTLLSQGVDYTVNFIGSTDQIAIYSSGSTFETGNYSITVEGMRNTTQGYTMFPGTVSTVITAAGPPPVASVYTFGSMFVQSPEYRSVRGFWPMGDGNASQTVIDLAVIRSTGTFGAAQTWSGSAMYDGQYASSPTFTAPADAIRLDNIWAYTAWAGTDTAANIARKYRQKDFTIMCWFRRNTGPAGATVSTGSGGVVAFPMVTKGMAMAEDPGMNVNYFLGLNSTNRVVCDLEQVDTGTNRPITGSLVCAQDQWHLAVMSFDGACATLFADGTIQGYQYPTTLADWHAQSRLTIGAAVTALNQQGTGSPTPDTPSGWWPGNLTNVVVMAHSVDEHFVRRAYDAGRGSWVDYPTGSLVSPTRFPAQGSTFVVRFVGTSPVDDATVVPGEFQLLYRGYTTGTAPLLNQGTWSYTALGSGTHYAMSYNPTNDQATFSVLPPFGAAWPPGDYRLVIS